MPISPVWILFHLFVKFPAIGLIVALFFVYVPIQNFNMEATASSSETNIKYEPMVALTFDDGFVSVYDQALPEMFDRGMVGTTYITTSFLNTENHITTDQLLQFKDLGWEIGAHTIDHPNLMTLSNMELIEQLREPYHYLEGLAGPINSLSSPFGEYNGVVIEHAKSYYTNHVNAYSSNRGVNPHVGFYAYNIHRIDTAHVSVYEVCDVVKSLQDEMYVLIFHQIGVSDDIVYNMSVKDFDYILDCIEESNIETVTITEGARELLSRSTQ